MVKDSTKDIISKYESMLETSIKNEKASNYSVEYKQFRSEALRSLGWYEKLCKSLGKALTIKLSAKDEEKIGRALEVSHIEVKPGEAAGLAVFVLLLSIVFSVMICAGLYLITNSFPVIVFLLLVFISLFLFYYLNDMPKRIEQQWRLKAASQMVPCILYIVIYMRHTSNLERAVRFAAQHLQPPLSLDLKKVFWNVETGKYSSIKESLDSYLESWREYSLEFVESFHLIESSLYEPTESRRVEILDKALEVILDGIYEKMLHYTHDIRAPITNIYMIGIVLPTLGLALLPLASTLLQGAINWFHVMLLFDVMIPFFVFYMTNQILTKRPGGFGESELLERNPNYKNYASKSHYVKAFFIILPLLFIGIMPLLVQYGAFGESLKQMTLGELGLPFFQSEQIFGFRLNDAGQTVGPFGIVALIMSLFIPLSIALFFSISYKLKTQGLLQTRKETKQIEKQFAESLFQLGNRLADNVPAEMAFGRVAYNLKGTATAGFFNAVNMNIQQAGMSVEDAIFNKNRGAIIYYPSDLIRTSMEILVESVKKGLQVAARSLMSISQYVKNIHKVNERLKDLLADILSEMRSNMGFLAPLLSAIVVGLSSMITLILSKLIDLVGQGKIGEGFMGMQNPADMIQGMFNVNNMIPPYWLQIIIGIYLIEIVFILTSTLTVIESGSDKLTEKSEKGKMLNRSMLLYFLGTLIAIIALAGLAAVAVGNIAS